MITQQTTAYLKRCQWERPESMRSKSYICGYCGHRVSSSLGLSLKSPNRETNQGVYLCPECKCPSFILSPLNFQEPGSSFGRKVLHLPEDLEALYEEARMCTSAGCFTAAVLILRKMIVHVAVSKGAKDNLRFIEYVDYLENQHFLPPDGRNWADQIRSIGNIATHEIVVMTGESAEQLTTFMEMLLRFIYEFPSMVAEPEG